jgi:hypothetical protein
VSRRFVLTILLGNTAAFGGEVADALTALATRLRRGIYSPLEVGDTGLVTVDGKDVGHWLVESSLKTYLVGNAYEFQAEDPEHAVEQYHNAMAELDTTEANFVREVE